MLVTRPLGPMIPFQMGEARGNRTSTPRTPEPSNAVACVLVVRSIPPQYHHGYWGQQGGGCSPARPCPSQMKYSSQAFVVTGVCPSPEFRIPMTPSGRGTTGCFLTPGMRPFPLHPPSSTTMGCWIHVPQSARARLLPRLRFERGACAGCPQPRAACGFAPAPRRCEQRCNAMGARALRASTNFPYLAARGARGALPLPRRRRAHHSHGAPPSDVSPRVTCCGFTLGDRRHKLRSTTATVTKSTMEQLRRQAAWAQCERVLERKESVGVGGARGLERHGCVREAVLRPGRAGRIYDQVDINSRFYQSTIGCISDLRVKYHYLCILWHPNLLWRSIVKRRNLQPQSIFDFYHVSKLAAAKYK